MKDKNNINELINTKADEEKIENNIFPKVSIIVPIYNVEKYLRQCLDSIVNQTLKDIEIILVDDGSTDSCPSICDEYASKDKRIIVIHKQNQGLGAAYNTGLDIAKGEYIGFVESDDFIELNMYEELYKKAVETGVDVVIGGFYFVNNEVKKPETSILNSVNKDIFDVYSCPQMLNTHSSVWSKIYKKDFLNKNNIKFNDFNSENFGYYCDIPFWTTICCVCNKFSKVDKILYNYRIDNPNASSVNSRNDSTLLNIIPALHDTLNISKIYNKYEQLKENIVFSIAYTAIRYFFNIDYKYKKEFFDKFRKLALELDVNDNFKFLLFDMKIRRHILAKDLLNACLNNDYDEIYTQLLDAQLNSKDRFKKRLDYRLGCVLAHSCKNIRNFIMLPYDLANEYKSYKKEYIEEFVPLDKCIDYKHSIPLKNHLSYILGSELVKTKNIRSALTLPFRLGKALINKKKAKPQPTLINISTQLNELQTMMYELRSDVLASVIHPNVFSEYRNLHANEDIVLLGNGASANYYKIIKNAIHIGVNRAFKMNKINFKYFFVQHALYPEGSYELEQYIEDNKNTSFFLGTLPVTFTWNNTHYRHNPDIYAKFKNVKPYIIRKHGKIWATDISYEPIGDFESVIFAALQFACYLNAKRIYLVGCDCSTSYFYKTKQHEQIMYHSQINTWKAIKPLIQRLYPHIQIISINPIGLKDVYTDVYTDEFKKDFRCFT